MRWAIQAVDRLLRGTAKHRTLIEACLRLLLGVFVVAEEGADAALTRIGDKVLDQSRPCEELTLRIDLFLASFDLLLNV